MTKTCLSILLLLFLIISCTKAQEVTFEIYNSPKNAELFQLEGEKTRRIDSLFSDNGKFNFSFKDRQTGLYRLQFDNQHAINFIYSGEETFIKTDYDNILESLKVINSETNKFYYDFIRLNKTYKTKTDLLNLILARYPDDDAYYEATNNRLIEIQKEYFKFVNKTSQSEPSTFISRYISTSQLPIIPKNIEIDGQLDYLKSYSLDNVDFNDAGLIFSDAFTNKTIEYLTYYRNPQLPKELLEKEFMKAVDTLLNKAKVNQLVYQHITEYLIDGFKKFGFDKIIDYIVENYIIEDDLCLDEETENSIQRRIDQSKLLSVGTRAPNIIIPNKEGNVIDLSKINTDKTLIVFYASWCPHCKKLVPRLDEYYTTNKEITILAISLDRNKDDWIKFIKENKIELVNINDPNGWDGTAASDYYIYATPTMFLLDEEKKIIGKPTTFNELKKLLDSK